MFVNITMLQYIYVSYTQFVGKFNGIKLMDEKDEEDQFHEAGSTYVRKFLLPTEILPAGIMSGTAKSYNEFGSMVACYVYQIRVAKATPKSE